MFSEGSSGGGGGQTSFKGSRITSGLADSFKKTQALERTAEIDSAMKELFKAHKFNSQYAKGKDAQALLIQDSEEKLAKILGEKKVNSSFENGKLFIEGKEINFIKKEENFIKPEPVEEVLKQNKVLDAHERWVLDAKINEVKKVEQRYSAETKANAGGFVDRFTNMFKPKTIGEIAAEKQAEKLAIKNAETKSGNIVSKFFSKMFSSKEKTFGEILEKMAEKGKIHR